MMNQKLFLDNMTNHYNDIARATVTSLQEKLQAAGLLSDEVKSVIDEYSGQIKQNKKIRKPLMNKKTCGYHIWLRKMRAQVAKENPELLPKEITGIISRMWTNLSDEEKKVYNDQAAEDNRKAKEESNASAEESDNTQKETGESSSGVEKKEVKKPAAKKAPKKKSTKSDTEEDSTANEEVLEKPKVEKKKPAAKKAPKKKKDPTPPPSDDEDEDDVRVVVEELQHDVDL